MSTLAELLADAAPTTRVADPGGAFEIVVLGVVVALSAVGVWVAVRVLRAHRPSAVAGPGRLPASRSVGPMIAALGLSILTLFAAASAYGPATTAGDLVAVSVIGPVAGLMVGIGLLLLVQPDALPAMGLVPAKLPAGARAGLVAAAVAVPLTFLAGYLTQQAYDLLGFDPPPPHDLLKAMKSTPPLAQAAGVLAAVLVAPVAEEFLFRGLLQTAVTEWLAGPGGPADGRDATNLAVADKSPEADVVPAASPADGTGASATDVAAGSGAGAGAGRRAAAAWAGIVVTSVLFGLVHPLWMFPIIFFLSVCLGYAYERTGNLWTSMTLHATFNAVSTVLYLSGASA
jgi:membrane protease YdiL (CAAX protease family)